MNISSNASGYYPISYKAATKEIVYHSTESAFKGYVAGGFECNTLSVLVTDSDTPVTFTSPKRCVGGLGLSATPGTNIILPVVGTYEVTSILQCGLTAGSPASSVISAWHSLNGLTGIPGQMETGVRSLYVTNSSGSILTTSMMFQTAIPNEYVQLHVAGTTAALQTKGGSFGGTPSTNPAVFTTVKLVG